MATVQIGASNIITRNQLYKLKLKAMRAGVWFKALLKIDRVLVDLTIKVADSIRSSLLVKRLYEVPCKLGAILTSRFVCLVMIVGRSLAEKASLIAQCWGNYAAKSWSTDTSFALCYAAMQANA